MQNTKPETCCSPERPLPAWLKECRIPAWWEVERSYRRGEYIPAGYLTKESRPGAGDGKLKRPERGNNPFMAPRIRQEPRPESAPIPEPVAAAPPNAFAELKGQLNYLQNRLNEHLDTPAETAKPKAPIETPRGRIKI